jgi:hypothetical protein
MPFTKGKATACILAGSLSIWATIASAGEVAKGKICDYDPHAFGRPVGVMSGQSDRGGDHPKGVACEGDWSMGGNGYWGAYKARILEIGPPPYVVAGCEPGREHQVLIKKVGGDIPTQWIFPRFLKCP